MGIFAKLIQRLKRKKVNLYMSEKMARQRPTRTVRTVRGTWETCVMISPEELDCSGRFGDWRKVGEAWEDEV